jgi:hypothetical protein
MGVELESGYTNPKTDNTDKNKMETYGNQELRSSTPCASMAATGGSCRRFYKVGSGVHPHGSA